MNESQKAILHVFDEHVFGAMRTELDCALRGGAANLAALGLVTYTEFLGGILTGNLGRRDASGSNFRAFLPYLGADYKELAVHGIDIYERVRCGLEHEYFIKGESTVWSEASAPCGIISSANGPTYFIVSVYCDHLFAGAQKLRDEILEDQVGSTTERAKKALSAVGILIP